MDVSALATELSLPAYIGMDDQAAADAMNVTAVRVPIPIEPDKLILWGSNGASEAMPARVIRCKLASELKPPFESIGYPAQGAAAASLALFGGSTPFTWYEERQQKLVGFLVSAGVFSQAEVDDLVTNFGYAVRPKFSETIYSGQVAEARKLMVQP